MDMDIGSLAPQQRRSDGDKDRRGADRECIASGFEMTRLVCGANNDAI